MRNVYYMQHLVNYHSRTYTGLRVIQHTEVNIVHSLHALITITKLLIETAGVSHYELDEPLESDDTVIPRHLNPCYHYTAGNVMKK